MPSNGTGSLGENGHLPADVPVLIVGGGPVGLSMSILLSQHGVRSLLVEQHPDTSPISKARFINARTMEIFQQVGLEQALREREIPHARNVIAAASLAGEEIAKRPVETMIPEAVSAWSPTSGCTSTQELFEPVLLARARELDPAQIRFSTQLASFEQEEDHVLATLVHRPSGHVTSVRAQYLIGADGGHSPVRDALGIRMFGQPVLAHYVNILFRANLARWVADREINLCFITNPQAPGVLLSDGRDHWGFMAFYFPERGQHPKDFTSERCLEIVRTVVGVPDLSVEIQHIAQWNDAAQVAERFSDGRVFLVGDATHLMSPAGGFGMNVGIQDAHNLAWKLAAVLHGWASPALLASYESECAPVSRAITEQMMRNLSSVRATDADGLAPRPAAPSPLGRPELFREHGLVFGATYDSSTITPDGTLPTKVDNPVTEYVPSAHPGSRAPHVWLSRGGERISTIDLFGREFVLVAANEGERWCHATRQAARTTAVPLQSYKIGPGCELEDPERIWKQVYGLEDDGAVLVRPDGYVAWRRASQTADPSGDLVRALERATGRGHNAPDPISPAAGLVPHRL